MITRAESSDGLIRLTCHQFAAEARVMAAAQSIGVSVSRSHRSVLIVSGKTWKHNAAKLAIQVLPEISRSSVLIVQKATSHLGPGTSKLKREFLAALYAQAPQHGHALG